MANQKGAEKKQPVNELADGETTSAGEGINVPAERLSDMPDQAYPPAIEEPVQFVPEEYAKEAMNMRVGELAQKFGAALMANNQSYMWLGGMLIRSEKNSDGETVAQELARHCVRMAKDFLATVEEQLDN